MITGIDLNCDMGEGFGVYTLGDDEEIMPLISSANIACGFHASDPATMLKTVRMAKKYQVAVGAHPGYPDLAGFGRRAMDIAPEELKAQIIYQIGALLAFCRAEDVPLRHVKLHGALYNRAAVDMDVACAVAEAVRSVSTELYLVCLARSAMVTAAEKCGVRYVREAFADRAYVADGTLLPRSHDGSVIKDPLRVAERVVRMVREQRVEASDGTIVPLSFQTICVHGDTPGALETIRKIRKSLERENIRITAEIVGNQHVAAR
jgi:UPF0271 protein